MNSLIAPPASEIKAPVNPTHATANQAKVQREMGQTEIRAGIIRCFRGTLPPIRKI
ncbi:MAG: hypothetical protein ABSF63_03075 [Candidatus Bathyarchaeia archaeon]